MTIEISLSFTVLMKTKQMHMVLQKSRMLDVSFFHPAEVTEVRWEETK